jgi:integrase
MTAQRSPGLPEIDAAGSTTVAPSRKFNFTKKLIESKRPAKKRYYVYDSTVRGLTLAVYPTGTKTFVVYRKLNGKPERVLIGSYPDLTIEQARKRAEEVNAAIARGDNPADQRRTVRDEDTLVELFERFIEDYAKPRKRTWRDDVGAFNLHLHGWRMRKISTITRGDVARFHLHIGRTRGKYAANRIVELLSSMFNRAREWGWSGDNPAVGIKPFREAKRDRFLKPEELPLFFKALADEPNETIRDYIALSLMTGARRSNVQEMRWDQIDWQHATWRIPETKNGQPQTVVTSPAAVRILERRKLQAKSDWVFPGSGRTGHLIEPKSAWKRICKGAGLDNLRIHDLRRTLGSWQAAGGTSLPIIGKSLGHSSLAATQIYARLDLDPVRRSVNRAVDAMLVAAGMQLPDRLP